MSKSGRNDPCPCGSGKKYKNCCLRRDESERARQRPRNEHFITELRPDLNEAVDHLLARVDRGEGQQVHAAIAELLEEHPNYYMTNYAMGVWHAAVAHDSAAALPFFEKAAAIYPLFTEAHFNLAMAARQTLDPIKAIEAFRAAERSDPGGEIGAMAREQLQALERMVLQDSPFQSLDAFLENAKLFDRAYQRLYERGFSEAIELFQRVLKDNPKHVQSYGNLALAYAGLGRRGDALACLDKAVALDPNYGPAIFNRGTIEEMREGEPFVPQATMEVSHYADRLRSARKRL